MWALTSARWELFVARLGRHGGDPRFDRGGDVTVVGQLDAQRLEGVQPQLTESLAFGVDPFVVPIGEEAAEREEFEDRSGVHRTLALQHALGDEDRHPQVDRDVPPEREARAGGLDEAETLPADPPQRRAEVAVRPLLCLVRPERERNEVPHDRPALDGEECEEPLRGERHRHDPAPRHHLETAEQVEPNFERGQFSGDLE